MVDLLKQKTIEEIDLSLPLALDPKNFTSLKRTPWAGSLLAKDIKQHFVANREECIGESWEISCDPDSPSKLAENLHLTLPEVISARGSECLSKDLISAGRSSCDILVKLLNAASPLSLQIHPSDENPFLKPHECGKPESWLILKSQEGSGLYLGFNTPISKSDIESKLNAGTFESKLLQFVPVSAGDYFEIDPHVPHAIGPGVVLLEPQRIVAGKSGKTWRLWDWNRKYNAEGKEDSVQGKSRELHISESMPLLEPSKQVGAAYVDSLRRKPRLHSISPKSHAKIFPANKWYQTILVDLNDTTAFKIRDCAKYLCVTIIEGSIKATNSKNKSLVLKQGESFFFPSASLPIEWANQSDKAIASIIIPAGVGVENHEGLIFSF